MTILVDGGIRTGVDVCKALALGADGVLLARPYVTAVYGGGAEGVRLLTQKLKGDWRTPWPCAAFTACRDLTGAAVLSPRQPQNKSRRPCRPTRPVSEILGGILFSPQAAVFIFCIFRHFLFFSYKLICAY